MLGQLPGSGLEGSDHGGPDLSAPAMGLAVGYCDMGMVGLRPGRAYCVSFGFRGVSEARLCCVVRWC